MNNRNIEFNVSFISFIRKLSKEEIRLLYLILNNINWDSPQTPVQLSTYEMYAALDLEPSKYSRMMLDEYLKNVMKLQISCKEAIFNTIYAVEYLNNAVIRVEISPLLKENFINILKTIAIIPLELVGQFKSNQSAFLFWKLCEEYCQNINVFNFSAIFTTEETKKIFDIKDSQYRNAQQSNTFLRTTFEKMVIDKSMDEINGSKIGMKVNCEKLKEGNRVLGYKFNVCFNDIGTLYRPKEAENMRVQLFGKEGSQFWK